MSSRINSWVPSELRRPSLVEDQAVGLSCVDALQLLVWYKNIVLPKKMLNELSPGGINELKAFKICELPAGLLGILPGDTPGVLTLENG